MQFEWKDLLPLAGVVIGWFLNQITQSLIIRKERKRALGRVLEGLLDVRHRLRSVPFVTSEIARRLAIGPRDQLTMSIVFSGLIPVETLKSFDDAVTAVAAEDPVLGYRLRFQNLAPTIVEQLRRLSLNDATATQLWAESEKDLMGHLLPHLEELILEVARIRSWVTWFQVRRTLRRQLEVPESLIDGLIHRIQQTRTPVGFGVEAEWKAFMTVHAEFMRRYPKLSTLLNRVFIRSGATNSPSDRVVLFLGRLMVEDFMEILLLCGNGYGVAGLKLLRGMYERAVTATYLSKNPSEAERFLDYHHVQEWKLCKRMVDTYKPDTVFSPEHMERMKADFERVRSKFTEVLCEKCRTTRLQISWSPLDTASMALKAEDGLGKLYLLCYLIPTLQSHATVSSLVTRMKTLPEGGISFDEGAQREKAGMALNCAHNLLLQSIDLQNKHFRLGLDGELQGAFEDFQAIWKSLPDQSSQ